MTTQPRTSDLSAGKSATSRAGWASSESRWEASSAVAVVNEVLISFFDSKQAALRGLALVDGTGREHSWRSHAVVVSRRPTGPDRGANHPSRGRSAPSSVSASAGSLGRGPARPASSLACSSGCTSGSSSTCGAFSDAAISSTRSRAAWRPDRRPLSASCPRWSAARIESYLDPLGAVTVHRFPGHSARGGPGA